MSNHDHLTGKFRGAAHNRCNLNYKYATFLPVFMHNLKGYDSHLLLQGMGKFKDYKISCIPTNSEKFISFSLGNLRFLDSLQFMSASLEKLADTLEHHQFQLTSKYFGEKTSLMLKKGIFTSSLKLS